MMIELNDAMRNLSSQCLRFIKCSVIIQFASPRELTHPMHSHKTALLSTRCNAKRSQQNSAPQTRHFQPEMALGNTKLYHLFLFRSEKCSLDRSPFHRVTFWPLLCLPACLNPVSCQFSFKIDTIPGAVAASSTTSCPFGITGLEGQFIRERDPYCLLWQGACYCGHIGCSLSLCGIWLSSWITLSWTWTQSFSD